VSLLEESRCKRAVVDIMRDLKKKWRVGFFYGWLDTGFLWLFLFSSLHVVSYAGTDILGISVWFTTCDMVFLLFFVYLCIRLNDLYSANEKVSGKTAFCYWDKGMNSFGFEVV
jgi:hypothetical protein